MNDKRVVITGATSGIGQATALALGKSGANILMVSRDRTRGIALSRQIANFRSGARSEFIEADLSSLEQVKGAAAKILTRWKTIDVLINNAGARFDTYGATADGCERTFATNHLGHFLLTGLLLDPLISAPSARIITVSSSAAAQADSDGPWQYGVENFDRKQAYAKSKLANLIFTFELARRLRKTGTVAIAVDPGVVATRFALNNGLLPWLKHWLYHGRRMELRRPSEGADTLVHLASTPVLPENSSGAYFKDRRQIRACSAAYDPAITASLWNLSTALTGLDPAVSFKEDSTH